MKKIIFGCILVLIIAVSGILMNLQRNALHLDFITLQGEQLSFEKLRGKSVLVTFWATDCENCLKEIPFFIDLYERYHGQGLEIIGVSMYYDPPNHVIEFNKSHPFPYPITLDINAEFSNIFGNVKVTPTTFLLNRAGKIVWEKIGLIDKTELTHQIEKFLKEK
jgi:peroxiredoxin